jgi:tRNA pseudouridine38-40 synthase
MPLSRPPRPTCFPIKEGQRRIKITVAYDGAAFHGWQRQPHSRSVQEEIEHALKKIVKEKVTLHGSGRTDTKVHALGQVAHFDTSNQSVPPQSFSLAINHLLSHEIRILESVEVDDSFHARFATTSREYRYVIKEHKDFTPFDADRVCRVRSLPPLPLLNEYAKVLVGIHDFSTFCSVADQSISKVRDVYESKFEYSHFLSNQPVLLYIVRANAFMMHQVRSMVGTMLQLGESEENPDRMREILESKDRLMALRTAPPDGLYLYRIEYGK